MQLHNLVWMVNCKDFKKYTEKVRNAVVRIVIIGLLLLSNQI